MRIIIGIVVAGILLLNSFYFLQWESLLYLKSDITDFKKLIMPISIILTILVTFFGIFDKIEYGVKIWSKIGHIFYIGMMCIIIYPVISDFVLMIGLKTNRLSSNEIITKKFIVTFKPNYWDLNNTVWGIIPNKIYENGIDNLKLNEKDFNLVYKNQEIELELEKGLFGIPFNPIIKK
ncbi:hypothetical protein [Polaribacter sp.]|uniref:hypothetical protein n=1 Tax=Polaribacter sp. TaxID=1920175 RepID=UPI003EF37930